jgi:hypothetical protein
MHDIFGFFYLNFSKKPLKHLMFCKKDVYLYFNFDKTYISQLNQSFLSKSYPSVNPTFGML